MYERFEGHGNFQNIGSKSELQEWLKDRIKIKISYFWPTVFYCTEDNISQGQKHIFSSGSEIREAGLCNQVRKMLYTSISRINTIYFYPAVICEQRTNIIVSHCVTGQGTITVLGKRRQNIFAVPVPLFTFLSRDISQWAISYRTPTNMDTVLERW
jgi:hypothetical protein